MRLLYLGDVVGKAGRTAVTKHLPGLRDRLKIDFAVVNGENAAHGFGMTPKTCQSLFDAGADVIVSGNHAWDRKEIIQAMEDDVRLLRPLNHAEGTPGRGAVVYTLADGRRVLVGQIMTRLFMAEIGDPFEAMEALLKAYPLGQAVNAILVDVHGEATSEKTALGVVADGRASMVVGSHTHVPTADTRILPGGTAYQTDAGMCGDYDSVIGMKKDGAIGRFIGEKSRLGPAEGEASLAGVFVETDDDTGLAVAVRPVRIGGKLQSAE